MNALVSSIERSVKVICFEGDGGSHGDGEILRMQRVSFRWLSRASTWLARTATVLSLEIEGWLGRMTNLDMKYWTVSLVLDC